ncbi:hypothetical protein MW7_016480 [Imbroritus primus]|uniref:Uncharacterized protein n=1 Tax=Imbroritus primus TaxID=3058603 RepID=A0ACD3SKA8_9BURK|nr:hypothetical protein MW7_016480 [Burkholderiaceae bacterium PBA]
MRLLDFSSWQTLLTTIVGLALITLIGVGIRLVVMQTIQQRRERENRQINERLRTLIAAYKVLGGSFTGDLSVDPTHLRDIRMRQVQLQRTEPDSDGLEDEDLPLPLGSDRARRVRDAVEAALSDIMLLGTEEQVRLAATAAHDLVAGRSIRTAELVVSLRTFIRGVLDLEPVPESLTIPSQGPTRPASAGMRGGGSGAGGRGGPDGPGGGRGGGRGGGGRGGGGGAAGGGAAMGLGMGAGLGATGGAEAAESPGDR